MARRSPRVKPVKRPLVERLEDRCLPSAAPDVLPMLVSNDTYYTSGSLWGMYGDETLPRNIYGSQAGEAWAAGYVGSDDVYVAVIDEGIDFNHPDLVNNIWTNPYDPIDGIDNDGNGYADDIHGWDFYHNDNSIYDGAPGSGIDAHGTHVAGTIGASGGNGLGVAGVNWNVTIISAKFLGTDGGYISDAARAVRYITDLKTRHGLNIVAMNNSWGGGGYSSDLHGAIIDAAKAGILFVAAAGNSGSNNDRWASYPANYSTVAGAGYESVISVAAIDSKGAKPGWSSYGKSTVDLGAPGVGIVSTTPGGTYSSYSGTSMATPHVTGAAALYASVNPTKTATQIRSAILSNTEITKSMQNKTVTGGRLNVAKMLGLDAGTVTPTGSSDSGSSGGSGSTGGKAGRTQLSEAGQMFLDDADSAIVEVARAIRLTPIVSSTPVSFVVPTSVINRIHSPVAIASSSQQMVGWSTSTADTEDDSTALEISILPAFRIEAPRPVTPPAMPSEEPTLESEVAKEPLVVSLSQTEQTSVSDEAATEGAGEVRPASASLLGLAFILVGLRLPCRQERERRRSLRD